MSYEIKANHKQLYLLPPSVDDWLPENDPARFIKVFVESLDLKELGFRHKYTDNGRPHYGNELLLSAWLYGYMHKIRSSRKLEQACYRDIGLIWLLGHERPDHNTLWRFFRKNGRGFRKVFRQTVRVSLEMGMIGFELQALDGTKIQADADTGKKISKKQLNEQIEEYIKAVRDNEKLESGLSYVLPKDCVGQDQLKEKIEKLKELTEDLDTDDEEINETDPDSRLMGRVGQVRSSYNAQIMVDSEKQVIVGNRVSQEANDSKELVKMLTISEQMSGSKSKLTVADGGYCSGMELKEAKDQGYEVCVSLGRQLQGKGKKYHVSQFVYEGQTNEYVCPEGVRLKEVGESTHRGHRYKKYRCDQFRVCGVSSQCSRSKRGREVHRYEYSDALEEQRLKQTEAGLKKRKQVVEPVFGWIKHNEGFRRWSVRGLSNVQKQWDLVCTSVNLKKIYSQWMSMNLESLAT